MTFWTLVKWQISRSPPSAREPAPVDASFGERDGLELPHYDDHTFGEFEEPEGDFEPAPVPTAAQRPVDWPTRLLPSHPLFGESLVEVSTPPCLGSPSDAMEVTCVVWRKTIYLRAFVF